MEKSEMLKIKLDALRLQLKAEGIPTAVEICQEAIDYISQPLEVGNTNGGKCKNCAHRPGKDEYSQCMIFSSEDQPWESNLDLIHREDGSKFNWTADYLINETIDTHEDFGCSLFKPK